MEDYLEVGLRDLPVMSARERAVVPPPLAAVFDVARMQAAADEPFVGVTSDGAPRAGLFPLEPTGVSTKPIVDRALALLDALDAETAGAMTFPVDSREWRTWLNVHMNFTRHGVMLEDLTADQRAAALALVRAGLSAQGYTNARAVMRLNELLLELTDRAEEYGEWLYFLSIFGTPSTDEPWGWQLDGHHLNVNCAIVGDQVVMTPTFMGAEPTRCATDAYAGISLFGREEANGLALVRSLSPEQAGSAVLHDSILPGQLPPERTVPVDGQMAAVAFADNARLPYEGLPGEELSAGQRRLLRGLVATYAGWAADGHAQVKMREVDRHLDETWFCWMGATDDVGPFYYRVHSPVVLIEFNHEPGIVFADDNPNRHHVHTVVRTPNGNDYGADLLRQHYERFDHGAG